MRLTIKEGWASKPPFGLSRWSTKSFMSILPDENYTASSSSSPNPNSNHGSKLRPNYPGNMAAYAYAASSKKVNSRPESDQQHGKSSARTSIRSAPRRTHMVSGNHLLNFQYDPISRPQSRLLPPRRYAKKKPNNKDLFLQANYKLVLLDSGNYSMDPDKMLQWEDIVCVRYSTPFPVQCPICLEDPLCPQITSCGHIFCFPCLMQYFIISQQHDHKDDFKKKCPLCFMMISSKDLYTIQIDNVKQHRVGDVIEFFLLTCHKDSFTLSLKIMMALLLERRFTSRFLNSHLRQMLSFLYERQCLILIVG